MFHHGVKMVFVKPVIDHLGVGVTHVLAGVIIWPTERHRQESTLFGDLPVHVGIVEKTIDPVIVKHFPVKTSTAELTAASPPKRSYNDSDIVVSK